MFDSQESGGNVAFQSPRTARPILYSGLDLPKEWQGKAVHCPLIRIVPRSLEDPDVQRAIKIFSSFTHVVVTSKNSVRILFDFLSRSNISIDEWKTKKTIAVGRATAGEAEAFGIVPFAVADPETAEGVIEELERIDCSRGHFFWPRSDSARPVIREYFERKKISHLCCVFYETVTRVPHPLPDLQTFDEIIFTSPSTVDAFLAIFGSFPPGIALTPIGPVTRNHLVKRGRPADRND